MPAAADRLTLKYVPLAQAVIWDKNPKRHSPERLAKSIRLRGFRDPSAFDATLQALVEGNGRAEVLTAMETAGEEPPRGILLDKKGRWTMPVLFGLDAESVEAAEAYAVEHNALVLPDFEVADLGLLYDSASLEKLTQGWGENGDGFEGLVLDFQPVPAEVVPVLAPGEFPVVDENLKTEHNCPNCGYKWSGKA